MNDFFGGEQGLSRGIKIRFGCPGFAYNAKDI